MCCNVFLRNINYVAILKCPTRMLEYCFSKTITILEYNNNNLANISNELKQRTHSKETDY